MYIILILIVAAACYLRTVCFDIIFESKYAYKTYSYEFGHLYVTLSTKPEYHSRFEKISGWQPEITKCIF